MTMKKVLLAGVLLAALGTSVVAQELDDIRFGSARTDPIGLPARVVDLVPDQYVYRCNYLLPLNDLIGNDINAGIRYFQYLRRGDDPTCDYLSGVGTGYTAFAALELWPLVSPRIAPTVPAFYRRDPNIPEVAVLYVGKYAQGGTYLVVLAHQVINGVVQEGVGYDFISALYQG
jgi:hypothetical protein